MAGGALESRDLGVGQHFAELLDGGACERAVAVFVYAAECVAQAAWRDSRDIRQADTGRYQVQGIPIGAEARTRVR